MATFTQESIQIAIDNGEDAFIEIPSSLNNDGLAQIRTAMMRLAASETVENQVAGILNETIQVNSGATLQFRNSTGSTVTFTGTWEGAGAVDVQTFTSAGVINVAGTINLAGGISHTGGVTGKLRIGNNVGTNGNVPISVQDVGATGNVDPLEFYYASTDQAEPVINGTITGGHHSRFISYQGRVTLHNNHRNNSNMKNVFGNTHQISYTNYRSLINNSFPNAPQNDYFRYEGGATIYRGTGGYTHPAGLHIRCDANGAFIVNRGTTPVDPDTGGNYSDLITFECNFTKEGTTPEFIFSGHEDQNIRFAGHKAFRFEGDINLGTDGDIIQQYGTTFIQEGDTATSQNITCRNLFINGDLRANARLNPTTTIIQGTGRLIPGIRFGEPVTFLGNLTFRDGATTVITIGEDDIDNVLVLGTTTFSTLVAQGINIQIIVFGPASAANLTNETRGIFFCTGGITNLLAADVGGGNERVTILPYNGTEASNKSQIDPTNAHHPAITNDNFAPSLSGTTISLVITDKS